LDYISKLKNFKIASVPMCHLRDALESAYNSSRRAEFSWSQRTEHRELPQILERRWRAGQGGIARHVKGLLRRTIARCSYSYEHGIDKRKSSDGNGLLILDSAVNQLPFLGG
jgi:hypothetical protein